MATTRKRSASVDDNDTARPPRISVLRPYTPGARSCEGCHQRKVRCDREVPCKNCLKHGMTCVYPTRDPDAARKPSTVRDVSNRLERLENLFSRFAESREAPMVFAINDDGGRSRSHAESEINVQSRPKAYVNAIEAASQRPSDKHPNKSTWEILLNNSDSEPLSQDVSLDVF